jgi:hypothetical protein
MFKGKIIMVILGLYFIYNIYNLEIKESHWVKASEISRNTVNKIIELTNELPSGSKVYFKNLPGEYKSAWILRYGIHEVPELFINRKDLFFYYISEKMIDSNFNEVYIYDYNQGVLYKE